MEKHLYNNKSTVYSIMFNEKQTNKKNSNKTTCYFQLSSGYLNILHNRIITHVNLHSWCCFMFYFSIADLQWKWCYVQQQYIITWSCMRTDFTITVLLLIFKLEYKFWVLCNFNFKQNFMKKFSRVWRFVSVGVAMPEFYTIVVF